MSRRPPNPRRLHAHHHTRRRARAATRRRRWNTPICLLFGFLLTCGRSTAVLANLFAVALWWKWKTGSSTLLLLRHSRDSPVNQGDLSLWFTD